MPFSLQNLLLGIALPIVIAFVLTAISASISRNRVFTGTAAAVAVVLGFLAGYWLLKLGPVVPELDRDWLPYVAIAALVPAAIPHRGRGLFALQLFLLAVTVAGAGWVLVPLWESLEPSRNVHVIVWSGYTFLLSSAMLLIDRVEEQSLPQNNRDSRSGSLLWLFLIVATSGAGAALLLLSESLLFCQIMLAATAAFSGCATCYVVADRFFQFRPSLSGISLVYSLLLPAAMLTGQVNSFSSVPTASYVILPLTPLAYGLVFPRRSESVSWKRTLLVIGVALAICGLAIGLALAAEFSGESEY